MGGAPVAHFLVAAHRRTVAGCQPLGARASSSRRLGRAHRCSPGGGVLRSRRTTTRSRVVRRRGARSDVGRGAVARSGPAHGRPAATGRADRGSRAGRVGGGRRRCRHRDRARRRRGRRARGSPPWSSSTSTMRRCRGEQPDVARPRRRHRTGPAGRRAGRPRVTVSDGRRAGWRRPSADLPSPTNARGGRSSRWSTDPAGAVAEVAADVGADRPPADHDRRWFACTTRPVGLGSWRAASVGRSPAASGARCRRR